MDDIKQNLIEKWDDIKELLKIEYQLIDIAFKTWILPLEINDVVDNTIKITVPDHIIKGPGVNFINNKYGLPLKVCIAEVMNKEFELEFLTKYDTGNSVSSYNNEELGINTNKVRADKANLNSKYTFDTFVVGSNNRFAHSASLAVAEAPGEVYNPLFIWGGPGLGKTHLMHSIGHYIIEQNPDLNVLYVTSETFTNEVIESIRTGNQAMTKFRDKYRNIDVLLLDDVQFIIGKESTQEEFFHTFNELHSSKKAIILSSDKPPKDMEILEDRLRSRFEWGLIADIQSPNYETRMAILRKNAENAGCDIDDDIIQYIANNIKSNIRELEGAFNKVVALSNMNRDEKITLATAEEAIRDIITPSDERIITMQIVLDTVCNFYGISVDDILSKKRNREIAIPRQIVMYLCSTLPKSNYNAIGKFLGDRDHSTVIHGVKKIEDDLKNDDSIINDISKINKLLYPQKN